MATRIEKKERLRQERLEREAERAHRERARKLRLQVGGVVSAAVVALGILFALNGAGGPASAERGGQTAGGAGEFPFAVGDPGPGQPAPPIALPSTDGGTFDLASERGKTVLIYFQEGLGCQPCWDQIKDLEAQGDKLRSLGIDKMVSITTDPLEQLDQKVGDEGITTPVASDPDLAVSKAYAANQYGMMGDSRDGHSFVVVGPDGRIMHRGDYGGAPSFTMYVPVENLVADLRKGLDGSRS